MRKGFLLFIALFATSFVAAHSDSQTEKDQKLKAAAIATAPAADVAGDIAVVEDAQPESTEAPAEEPAAE